MLVLSRSIYQDDPARPTRKNEIVVLVGGERVVFRLLPGGFRGGQVKVGIDAPAGATILRGEVEDRQMTEQARLLAES